MKCYNCAAETNADFIYHPVFSINEIVNSKKIISDKNRVIEQPIYKDLILNGNSYDWLDHLSNKIGGRLSGSINAQKAVQYTKEELDKLGLDKVWLQPVMVPKWERGTPEKAHIEGPDGSIDVPVCALGGSIATAPSGVTAEVVEVQGLDDLAKYGEDRYSQPVIPPGRSRQNGHGLSWRPLVCFTRGT